MSEQYQVEKFEVGKTYMNKANDMVKIVARHPIFGNMLIGVNMRKCHANVWLDNGVIAYSCGGAIGHPGSDLVEGVVGVKIKEKFADGLRITGE